jgi:photosystem II stability/assembly factor-like uncharacterized protein
MQPVAQRRVFLPLLTVGVLLAGCVRGPAASSGVAQPTASPAVAQPTESQPPEERVVGRKGSAAWVITTQGVSVSEDGGRTFAQVPLPATVAPTAIAAVTVVPGTTWLASVGPGRSVTVYGRVSGSWSPGVQLTPDWPADLGGAEKNPPGVSIIPSGNQVVVMTQLGLSHSISIPRMFVSEDGGVTFAQRVLPVPSDFNTRWNAIAMSGTNAVAAIGELDSQVIHSSDAGSTWAPSTLRGIAPGADIAVGTPVFAGATIYLPVTQLVSDKGTFTLLRSTDGGAVFDALGAEPLALGDLGLATPLPVAAAGANWWLVSPITGAVYRSPDNGLTWSATGGAVPPYALDIAATDSENASATIVHNTCATGKTDCSSDQYSVITSDGGKTWTRVPS